MKGGNLFLMSTVQATSAKLTLDLTNFKKEGHVLNLFYQASLGHKGEGNPGISVTLARGLPCTHTFLLFFINMFTRQLGLP